MCTAPAAKATTYIKAMRGAKGSTSGSSAGTCSQGWSATSRLGRAQGPAAKAGVPLPVLDGLRDLQPRLECHFPSWTGSGTCSQGWSATSRLGRAQGPAAKAGVPLPVLDGLRDLQPRLECHFPSWTGSDVWALVSGIFGSSSSGVSHRALRFPPLLYREVVSVTENTTKT